MRTVKLITFVIFVVLSAFTNAKVYTLKGKPEVGSRFKTNLATSSVPFDKRYKQMAPEEQAIIRANYEDLGENDSPPFPNKGLKSIYLPLIKYHKLNLREGDLVAIATVSAKGVAEQVQVYSSPNQAMTEFIIALLFETKFDPGLCDGKPCQMEYLIDLGLNVDFN
ncbi:hypothetical protein [Sessilibacter sp. MAH2]